MKTISILVPEGAVAESVANPRYAFAAANRFLQAQGKPPAFNVQLVGRQRSIKVHDGFCSVATDKLLREVDRTDLIIIPALFGDMATAVDKNKSIIPWMVKHYHQGAEIAALCVGAFLLAGSGLLNGKKCSTHWAYYDEFRATFPEVEIADGSIITEEGGIYTSGGANSYWNLLLLLLEKYTHRDIAIMTAKYFAIDIDRNSQSSFMIFNGQKDHNDEGVKRAQEYIEAHYQEKFTVDHLADTVAIGRRSFERRFKNVTNNTVVQYIQRVKIEAAKRAFEATRKNIYEVMFDVGYTDTKAFRTVFKRITGLTPVEYRNKYNKGTLVQA